MASRKKVLLIDDDKEIGRRLVSYCANYDIDITHYEHPIIALEDFEPNLYDLVILDIMLPEIDGLEVCRRLRKISDLPIVMLSARGEVIDRIVGIELGADDYIPKPFDPRELVARVKNIITRRSTLQKQETQQSELLTFAGLQIDPDHRTASLETELLELTTLEYRLLELFAKSPGKNFNRDDLLNQLKGIDADVQTRSVDILVSRLRSKLKPLKPIKTVWGSGYCFIAPNDD
jgi:DNA-binding response OmpR family regulator